MPNVAKLLHEVYLAKGVHATAAIEGNTLTLSETRAVVEDGITITYLQDTAKQIQDTAGDESRIRQNISSLNNVSGQQQLVQTYARQLDTSEQQLAALRDKQADLQRKKTSLEAGLRRSIENLSF